MKVSGSQNEDGLDAKKELTLEGKSLTDYQPNKQMFWTKIKEEIRSTPSGA